MADAKHPNIALLEKLDIRNLGASENLFSDDFIWHYFNPKLPDLHGDYEGAKGMSSFFNQLNKKTNGSFRGKMLDARPIGDELLVTHVSNCLSTVDNTIEFDAVVIWRVVNNKIAEAWDIPAVYHVRTLENAVAE